MGFRCSLLGHDYDEPTTEEEREERGNEVVVTVRELETCSRCGAETVISENTEVRSIEAGIDPEPEPDSESATDAGELVDADEGDGAAAESAAEDGAAAGGAAEFEDASGPSAAEDDGVILDDDESDDGDVDDRDAGEWPGEATEDGDDAPAEEPAAADAGDADAEDADEAADAAESESAAAEPADDPDLDRNGASESADLTEWPDPGVEDEGFDAQPSGDDDVSVEFAGGLQPEAASGDADEGAEFVSASGSGITSTGPVERSDDVDTVLVCPECEFNAESVSTSQRPGDICPDCRRGYLTERER